MVQSSDHGIRGTGLHHSSSSHGFRHTFEPPRLAFFSSGYPECAHMSPELGMTLFLCGLIVLLSSDVSVSFWLGLCHQLRNFLSQPLSTENLPLVITILVFWNFSAKCQCFYGYKAILFVF